MKKILLIIVLILVLAIFQVVVLATTITIGSAPENRANATAADYTYIEGNLAANATGVITSVEIWAYNDLTGLIVATFTQVSANKFTVRDSEAIGTVTGWGYHQYNVTLNVQAGDWIGFYVSAGSIDQVIGAGIGQWFLAGDQTGCKDATFSSAASRTISICGTGATGWSHKWNTLTIGKWNTTTFTKWNGI